VNSDMQCNRIPTADRSILCRKMHMTEDTLMSFPGYSPDWRNISHLF
jgi:hypothetical protein